MREKLKVKEQLAYVSYSFGQTISMGYILALLSIFYTDVAGIRPATVATIYLVSRIWDAVNDPLIGIIIDKVHLKGGKFKPWLNVTVFALPIVTILLFVSFDAPYGVKVLYAFITYILWGMVYTISDVPAFALPTVMTDNATLRDGLIAKRMFGSAIAMMFVIPIAALVDAVGWLPLVIIYAGISFMGMLPIIRHTKERIVYIRQDQPLTIKEVFRYLKLNKYLLVFYLGYLAYSITNTASAMGSYFAKYNMGDLGMASVISAISIIPVFVIPLILPSLIRRFGKKKILLTGLGYGTVLEIFLYFIGYENFGVFMAMSALKTTGIMLPVIMLGMFTSDCVEYGHYIGGRRAEGITFSVQTFSAKLSGAIAGAMSLYLLDYYGFVENQEQTVYTLQGIWRASTLFPAIGHGVFFIVVLFFYHLKEEEVQEMIIHNKAGSING